MFIARNRTHIVKRRTEERKSQSLEMPRSSERRKSVYYVLGYKDFTSNRVKKPLRSTLKCSTLLLRDVESGEVDVIDIPHAVAGTSQTLHQLLIV